ncbi:MAG: AmpG family muropeptide MFS transporter [Planctomycetota bacterium]|nr:AmpG family muropeptide MFS transporter [Planctomycetota bacterium]
MDSRTDKVTAPGALADCGGGAISPWAQVFVSWRMAAVLLMGFSSGLPLALSGTTLQLWAQEAGVSLETIGLFAAVALPYTLKFLWSPLMDRYVPPLLGRRRGWMLFCQVGLAGGVAAMASVGMSHLWALGALAMFVAFFSASQDIVIDAYRAEALAPKELGAGTALYIMGYRAGMIGSGAMAFVLADYMSWPAVYAVMAAGMGIGVAATLLAPEPQAGVRPPSTLRDAVVLPFAEFLRRRGAIEMLLFIVIYKLDAAMVAWAMNLFMRDIGFTKTAIGINQGVGIVAMIAGATLGGAGIAALGIRRSLWIFGLFQGLAGASFTALALLGHNYAMMVGAILAENLCAGMATSAFIAFLMSLCDKRFTATQFALLTSLMALGRVTAGVPSGWLADRIGWPAFFLVATIIAAPSLLLLLRYRRWEGAVQDDVGTLRPPTRSHG